MRQEVIAAASCRGTRDWQAASLSWHLGNKGAAGGNIKTQRQGAFQRRLLKAWSLVAVKDLAKCYRENRKAFEALHSEVTEQWKRKLRRKITSTLEPASAPQKSFCSSYRKREKEKR